ncbi:hypothetical protein [Roseiflexus sp.]|uniref:hypothetical protein n=1 Tax=Roseiflexus sp. TaxID=2562120 RepID=UPI00258444C8|nr:hypothetical protein [Roseiflexus sp.]
MASTGCAGLAKGMASTGCAGLAKGMASTGCAGLAMTANTRGAGLPDPARGGG